MLVTGKMREYDQISDWYAANRSPEIGVEDVLAFAPSVAEGGTILDLGCGNGVPISQALAQRGFELFGIDSSPKMIARYRANVPGARAQCATIQESDFFDTRFDAAVAWGVLFHLDAPDQERVISKVSRHLKGGGLFLFTAGDEEGTIESPMNGARFRYVSLGSAAYRRLLHDNGFAVLDEHRDAWDNYVYVAQKQADTRSPHD